MTSALAAAVPYEGPFPGGREPHGERPRGGARLRPLRRGSSHLAGELRAEPLISRGVPRGDGTARDDAELLRGGVESPECPT